MQRCINLVLCLVRFFEANRLKQLESSESEGTALRLWKNNCPGLVVAYGSVEPTALVEKAIALSYLNPPETIELAEPRRVIYPNVGETVSVETLVEVGKKPLQTSEKNILMLSVVVS